MNKIKINSDFSKEILLGYNDIIKKWDILLIEGYQFSRIIKNKDKSLPNIEYLKSNVGEKISKFGVYILLVLILKNTSFYTQYNNFDMAIQYIYQFCNVFWLKMILNIWNQIIIAKILKTK